MSNITLHRIPACFFGGIARVESLKGGEIQIWRAPNEVDSEAYESFRELLTADEIERASKFRFERHRMQYVVGRSLLRILLAAYLKVEPRTIRFKYTPKGKPELAPDGIGNVQFNLAHSGHMILMGFTSGRRIGVDVEQIRGDLEVDEIAERFFSPLERRYLASLPATQRRREFFRFWARKEALLKATGVGLSASLDSFSVLFPGHEHSLRLQAEGEQKWLIQDIDLQPGYAAAVATED